MAKTFEIGDKVAYSVQFLRSVGCVTGDMPRGRGEIVELTRLGSGTTLARINWNNPELPGRVNVFNLAKVGLNTKFSAC